MFAMGRAKVIPKVFSKLHPQYGTPYIGIMFTAALCLLAPWFGRPVLLWIVDMSATGVTIAYFYTCFTAFKLFSWTKSTESNDKLVSPVKKLVALIGALSGLSFLGLLLIPSSPSSLGAPSLIALIVWTVLGIAFYLYKRKEYNQISKSTLDYYILGKALTIESVENNADRQTIIKIDA
jgi:amino acid transporter